MLWGMAILAILIAAGCTPALRPHDRVRGTSVIAVESAEPRVIKACPEDRHVNTSSRSPRVPLRRGGAEGSAALPPQAAKRLSAIPITVGYRLHGER
jgi:hypothetical protein